MGTERFSYLSKVDQLVSKWNCIYFILHTSIFNRGWSFHPLGTFVIVWTHFLLSQLGGTMTSSG